MPYTSHPLIGKNQGGFALISVLALVSLAALTATAFLASARLERQATLPMGNSVRLEWALASGEKCAEQTISDATEAAAGQAKNFVTTLWRGTNTGSWTNEVGYLLIGEPNATNSVKWTYYSGFSPSGLTNFSTNVIGSNTIFTNDHQGTFLLNCSRFFSNATSGFVANPSPINPICTTIDLLGGQTSPPVGWVYITQRKRSTGSTNEVPFPVARVAWFIEDLSGKIDAERMGALTGNRSTGTNPEEICLTNMTRTNGTQIFSGSVNPMTNATNRKLLFTPGLLANSDISGLINSDDLRYFATGLREFRPINTANMNGMLDWIPCGIPVAISGTSTNPYANSGSSKLQLNQLTTLPSPTNVRMIASVITNNLPRFASTRAGGMAQGLYISNIAANIVDLFDADNFPTTVVPSIRGIENYPFVNEIWDRYELSNVSVTRSNATSLIVKYDLSITTWVELWNMSSQAATNGTLRVVYRNYESLINKTGSSNIPVTFTQSLSYFTNVDLVLTNIQATPLNLTNCSIPPNSFHMVALPTYKTNFSNNLTIPPSTPATSTNLILLWQNNGNSNGFATYYGSSSSAFPTTLSSHTNLVDASSTSFDGIQRNTNPPAIHYLSPSHTVWWRGNATPNSDLSKGLPGDPRMCFYLSTSGGQTWFDHQFESGRASWWARNTLGAGASSYTVDLSKWPDASHNTTPYPNITDPSTLPTMITRAQETNKPVQIIYNPSPTNIIQLGQVFDPIQWSYNVTNNLWGVPVIGATANPASGGGNTLRIGRLEHPRFAFTNFAGNSTPDIPNMGASAAALLDLFCVTNGNTSGGPCRTGGKINLNTAPAPVLRALAGGILLTKDSAQIPANAAIPAGMAEAFAQGVMRFRSKYPFLTPSHLCFIGTDSTWPNTATWPTNAVFGNTNAIALDSSAPGNNFGTSTRINVTEWNDQAAEEWFSKIYNLSTVQSDNYRVYIVAQLVDTNKLPTGPIMRKYVQFANRPDSGTSIGYANNTNTYGVDMYFWYLTKGLKKVYESPY
jgi:hypothetical protein